MIENEKQETFWGKAKKSIKGFLMRAKFMLPYIILAVFIMLSTAMIFGKDNAVLGILFLFFSLMSLGRTFSVGGYVKSSILILCVVVLSTFAGLNAYTSAFLNFIVPFVLIMVFSDELSARRYFIYGLFFVLLQLNYPSSLSILPSRIGATLYGLAILFVFNVIVNKKNKQNRYEGLLKSGFSTLGKRAKLLATKRLNRETPSPLFNITNKMSKMLYEDSANKTGMLNQEEEFYFQSIIALEEIDRLLLHSCLKYDEMTQEDYEFIDKISDTFMKLAKDYKYKENMQLVEELSKLIKENHFSSQKMEQDWQYVIYKVIDLLKKYNEDKVKETKFRDALKLKWVKLKRSCNFKSCQFRFAIRVSIVLCIGFTLCHLIPFANAYWLPITAFTTMLPYYEDTKQKMSTYFVGAILGAICFVLLFQYVPSSLSMVFMVLAFIVLFSIDSEVLRNVVGTQLALVMCTAPSTIVAIDYRVGLVALAILITWLTDRFILNTNNFDGLVSRMQDIIHRDQMIIKELRKALKGNKNGRYLDELLLESYVLENEISINAKNTEKVEDIKPIYRLLNANKKFILEAEKLICIFNTQNIKEDDKLLIGEALDEMSFTLDASLEEKNEDINIQEMEEKFDLEDDYIERSMSRCMENIDKMYQMMHKA